MEGHFYFPEELPETYGKLMGFCTESFLTAQIEKAQELGLYSQALNYSLLRGSFRRSQRRKDPWPIKVAQFNEDLRASINTARLRADEIHKEMSYRSRIEDGAYKIGEKIHTGLGPQLGTKEDQNDTWQTPLLGPIRRNPATVKARYTPHRP